SFIFVVCSAAICAAAWAQSIQTVAGGGTDDGRSALAAGLQNPIGVAFDSTGNFYIADYGNNRIRKVSAATGIITTVAGNGTQGFTGDGGPADQAALANPSAIALDPGGNLYIADEGNRRIRKVDARNGIITTIAGNGFGPPGNDSGPALSTFFGDIGGIALNRAGDIFLVDFSRNKIRKITAATGTIAPIAGTGAWGYSGDGGPATSATFRLSSDVPNSTAVALPRSIVIDDSGNVYFADTFNHRVRKIDGSGIITTIAGNGAAGFSGDGGPAAAASLNEPTGLALDGAGNLMISEEINDR